MRYKKVAILVGLVFIIGGGVFLLTMRESQRKLTLSDFEFLEPGMNMDEIVARLGEPDRTVGSGLYKPVYFVSGGGVVFLEFGIGRSNLRLAVYDSGDGVESVLVESLE
jgi:hypothetical protein